MIHDEDIIIILLRTSSHLQTSVLLSTIHNETKKKWWIEASAPSPWCRCSLLPPASRYLPEALDGEESIISASEVEIASTIDELSLTEWQSVECKAHTSVKCKNIFDDIERAKNVVDLAKTAFERAQKAANDFSLSTDEAVE